MADRGQPSVGVAGPVAVEAHHATVLYDQDGRVVHVHHVVVFEGGDSPDEARRAELAHDAAARMGHDTSGLEALHVEGSSVPGNAKHSVDVESRSLRSENLLHPRRSRQT